MENEKVKRINEFLACHETSIDTISKQKISQFEKVDDAIQSRINLINQANEIIKNCKINISMISKDTNISRKTFYNNSLLKAFVENYSTPDEKTSDVAELEKIKAKNSQLTLQIKNFVLRDIETENLRQEIKELNREIHNLQIRNESLENQYEELQLELSNAKRELASYKTIIPFNSL